NRTPPSPNRKNAPALCRLVKANRSPGHDFAELAVALAVAAVAQTPVPGSVGLVPEPGRPSKLLVVGLLQHQMAAMLCTPSRSPTSTVLLTPSWIRTNVVASGRPALSGPNTSRLPT